MVKNKKHNKVNGSSRWICRTNGLHTYFRSDCERGHLGSTCGQSSGFGFVAGASTKWSERSPFTSEAAGSILRENFLNVTRTQCSTHAKRVSQHSAEIRGFSPGAPVSSHRKLTGCVTGLE